MKLTIRERIAIEPERMDNPSYFDWDDEQMRAWCFDEQFGSKYFVTNLQVADHLLSIFDIKEKHDETYDG